jgi:small subunit ribosomal protein S9
MIVNATRKSARIKLIYHKNKLGEFTIDNLPVHKFLNSQQVQNLINQFKLSNLGISIHTKGGGFNSKIQGCKLVLAKFILSLNPKNKLELYKIDRKILRSDARKKLPKKAECYGARAKRQKSYR